MAAIEGTAKARRPRFDWANKRDLCYKLYVEDKRQLADIVSYFTDELGFDASQTPSARDFGRQFVKWEFPHRRQKLTAEEEASLLDRLKQLWAANYVQKQMLQTLQDEGWELDEAALGRFRRKHNLVMRLGGGFSKENMGPGTGKKRKRDDEGNDSPQEVFTPTTETVSTDETARRAQRMLELQAASDANWEAKKRRRRIRGLAHLPPDGPDVPPRYKSETSLDECKSFLQLSNDAYKEVRRQFQDICENNNILKKTECLPGDWQSAKDQLVRSNIHLSAMLNPLHANLDERQNAVEVICNDVTKRMRTMKTRIPLKDANVMLGLDPDESKALRQSFYEILRADGFQSKLLCGKEHWEELCQQWIEASPKAQELHVPPLTSEKKHCIDLLLRDAMKRYNDNNVAKIPHMVRVGDASYGPGPGPAPRSKSAPKKPKASKPRAALSVSDSTIQAMAQRASNVDPALYAISAVIPTVQAVSAPASVDESLPAYFKLAPESGLYGKHSKMWLMTLPERSLQALHKAALSKSDDGRLRKLYGVVKSSDGKEDRYQIDGQDEFDAYLETIAEMADGKATFIVVLDAAIALSG